MKICSVENCNQPVWGKGLCKHHIPKSSLSKKKSNLKSSNISTSANKKEASNKMKEFFMYVWSKKPHISEISYTPLGNELKSIFFHHVLLKSKYKEAMYDEDNIILLTFQEHQEVHSNMYKFEEINKRRIELLKKYGL